MIQIDKTDSLYKYLQNLGIVDVDKQYQELAENGRFKLDDVRKYFRSKLEPSSTEDVSDEDLERVLDYYIDLKKLKSVSQKEIKQLLLEYKQTSSSETKEKIINSQLKDILYLCLNYKTLHKDVDVQDLIQVANIGLLNAINKYNPEAKIEFKDYVVYWVRESIISNYEEKTNG